jgi:uncharacterized membrane protein
MFQWKTELQKEYLIDMEDVVVVVTKDDKGKVKLHQAVNLTAAGAASHSDHGRDLVEVLLKVAEGKVAGYSIKAPGKLRSVVAEYGLAVDGKEDLSRVRVSNNYLR